MAQCLVTFFSTHWALKAEEVLKEVGLKARLIPVPRSISSSCTVALVFDAGIEKEVLKNLADSQVETDSLYQRSEGGKWLKM